MEALVKMKQAFPCNQFQFCTMHLKGVPFLKWLDDVDPKCEATVLIGKRRAESVARRDIPEFVDYSEHHGGRILWCPLYKHSDEMRNTLLDSHGLLPCHIGHKNALPVSMLVEKILNTCSLNNWRRSVRWRWNWVNRSLDLNDLTL